VGPNFLILNAVKVREIIDFFGLYSIEVDKLLAFAIALIEVVVNLVKW